MTGFELYQTITVRVPLPPDFAISYPVSADVGWPWGCERNMGEDRSTMIERLFSIIDKLTKITEDMAAETGNFW